MLWIGRGGVDPPPNFCFPWCVRDLDLALDSISIGAKWHDLNLSNGLSSVHKCYRQTTDHAVQKDVAIGGIG